MSSKKRNIEETEMYKSRLDSSEDLTDPNQDRSAFAAEEHFAPSKNTPNKNKSIIRVVIILALIAIIIILLIFLALLINQKKSIQNTDAACTFVETDYVTPRNFDNPELFDDMTPDEYTATRDFMLKSATLGIKHFNEATVNSSYIVAIDLFLPKKGEAIRYLDKGGIKPERKALVIVVRGDYEVPVIEEYIVSPLPKPKQALLYKNPSYKRHPIPFSSRPMDSINYKPFFILVKDSLEKMYPLLMESYGRCYHNCTKGDNCLKPFDTAPRGKNSGERKTWVWVFADTEGYYNHPVGLEMRIEHKSTQVSDWFVEIVVYNGQRFDSIDALMKAYSERTLKMIHLPKQLSKFSFYDAKGPLPETPRHGPRLFEPDGKRFSVRGQNINYGKWNFNYHIRPSTGMQIFNVKFNGERIAYEISLQEVLVMYTGYGPAQSNTDYYDVSWFIGATNMELVRGVDCPETAVFLDSYFFLNSHSAKRYKKNICIFENNGAIPMRRHYQNNYDDGFTFYGGVVDYHLVIRTVANVWNYDYIFDFIFYPNGAVEVKTTATGYVQATYALPEERQYGNRIHSHVMADLHVHVFTYKVDLDVVGEINQYKVLDIGLETVPDPWILGTNRTQMKITEHLVKHETTTAYKTAIPQYHLFLSSAYKNDYGAPLSYRILNKSPVPFLVADLPIANAAKYAKYPIIVTKRKDSEQDCSSVYAQHDAYNPVLDFDDFINGENLFDEDLVAWVTIGTHHVPGTNDVPSTPTTWNQYSFFLNPHNYFLECPSLNSSDYVVIRPTVDNQRNILTYGRNFEPKCIPKTGSPYDFDGKRYDL